MKTLTLALTIATSKIGTKELTGNNDGPFIDECLAVTGLNNQKQIKSTGKGYAWCAAFIAWVFHKAGVVALKTAWAPSWFPESNLVKNGKYQPMDVFGINYKGYENGHVGFIIYWPEEGEYCITFEGNWGNVADYNIRKKSEINAVSRWI